MTTPSDAQLREFLLRRLPAQEAARLEDAIIVTDGVAERLRDEEFDLIDAYAAGCLDAEDRADVERHLLTSVENVHSLRMARLLNRQSAPRRPISTMSTSTRIRSMGRRRWVSLVVPLGTVLAAGLVAVALIPDWNRNSRHTGMIRTAAPSEAPSALPSPAPDAADSIPIVTLLAEVNRGSGSPILHWKADAASVRLQAEVPGPDRNTHYLVRVYDAAGRPLFEAAALSAHTAGRYRFVDTILPSAVLGPGARTIALQSSDGAEDAAAVYTWHVVGALN
jgi:hypothetical protein